ncbi:hypothetical protein PGB90_005012 [Kerria lacca]
MNFTFSIKAQNDLENIISFEEYGSEIKQSPFKKCHNSSPPTTSYYHIPTYIINLDLPPEERWKELVTDLKPQIRKFIETIRNNTNKIYGTEIFQLIDSYLPLLTKTLPKEYYDELNGISEVTELSMGEVTIYNVFYEFDSLCTSIVMKDSNDKMYHGRNLDFGLLLGWNVLNRTWLVTELLKPLVVNVQFQRNDKTVYTSVHFAGYIGILTGIKKNAFALTVNERFKLNGGYVGIIEWILGRRDQKWNGIFTREVLEFAQSYKDAQKMLLTSELLAPVYFILSGKKSSQGCVITKGRNNNVDIWSIDSNKNSNSSWYLVQTNYDHWKKPPVIDDRVIPSMICMELFGRKDPIYTLFNVLSTIPILNKETVYSTVMEPATGNLKIWLQNCPDPCWPW